MGNSRDHLPVEAILLKLGAWIRGDGISKPSSMQDENSQPQVPILPYAPPARQMNPSPLWLLKPDVVTWLGAAVVWLLAGLAILGSCLAMFAGLGDLAMTAMFLTSILTFGCEFQTMLRRSFASAVLVGCWLVFMLIFWGIEFVYEGGPEGLILYTIFGIPGVFALITHARWAILIRRHQQSE